MHVSVKVCMHTCISILLPTQQSSHTKLQTGWLIELFIVHRRLAIRRVCMEAVMEKLGEQSSFWPLFTSQLPALVFIDGLGFGELCRH
jgi:hypothetical protein